MRLIMKQLLAISVFVSCVSAQSVFTPAQPVGMPVDPSCGSSALMSGVGTSVATNDDVMSRNVANLAALDRVEFVARFNAAITRMTYKNLNADMVRTLPETFVFGVPLGSAGAIGFGYTKQSDIFDKMVPATNSNDRERVSYDAQGGLSNWQLGYGIGIKKHIKIGAFLGFDNYRKISQRITDWYYDPDSLNDQSTPNGVLNSQWFAKENDSTADFIKGLRPGVGFMASLRGFSVGAQFSYPVRDHLTRTVVTRDSLSAIATQNGNYGHIGPDTVITQKYLMSLAPTLRVGISYAPSAKFLVALDGNAEFWKTGMRKNEAALLTKTTLHDAGGIGLGIRFVPAPDLLLPRYYEIIQYMAGVKYSRLADGTTNDVSASLGFGLPLRKVGYLDFGVSGGQRSSTTFTSYQERYINLMIGINGGISWVHSADDTY